MSIVKLLRLDLTTNTARRALAIAMRPVLLSIVATLCWSLACARGLQGGDVVDVKLVRDASVSEQKILAVIELRPADPTVWVSSEPELLRVLEQSPVEDIYAALEAFEFNNAAPQEYTEMVSDMPPPAVVGEAFDNSKKLQSNVASPTKLLQFGDAAVPSPSDREIAAAKTVKPIAQPAEFSENSQLEIVFASDEPEPLKRGPKREKKSSAEFEQDPIDLFLASDVESAKPDARPEHEHALLEEYSSPEIEPQKSNAESSASSVRKHEVEDPSSETPRKVGVVSRMLSQQSSNRDRQSSPKRLPTPPQVSGSSQQGLMSQWTTLQTTARPVYPVTSTPSDPIPQRASAAPAYPASAVARNNYPQPTGIAPPSPELLTQRIQLPRIATTRPESTTIQTSAEYVPPAPVAMAVMPRSEVRLPAATRTSFVEEPRTNTVNSSNNGPWFLQPFYASRAGKPEAKPNTKSNQSRHSSVARSETLEDQPSLVRQLFGIPGRQSTNLATVQRTQEPARTVPQVQPAAAQLNTSNAPIKKTSGDQLLEFLSELERIGEPRQMAPQRQRKLLNQSVTQLTPAEDTLVAGAKPPLATEADAWETLNGVELATFVEPLALPSNDMIDSGTGYVSTAAYFQTPAPPEDAKPEIGEEVPPPTGQDPADTIAGAETLGEEPVDNSLQFLRTATVLLEPGQTQFDYGLTYLLFETDFPILVSDGEITNVDEAFFKQREMVVPFELRVGVLKRLQAFLSVPVGWANTEVTFDGFDAFENDGGLGDISTGATIQLRDETPDCPAIITTLAVTAPTGQEPFLPVGLAPESATLGDGFWSISGSVLFIQTWDPLVVFYGVGTRQSFERDLFGFEVKPGGEYNYLLGVGFAVNDRVTLSTRFAGTYAEEVSLNGQRVPGTIQEPMTLRFAATIARKECLTEPFVEFGTTDDAVSSYFGIVWTH